MTQNKSSYAGDALRLLLAPTEPAEVPALLRAGIPKLVRGEGVRPLPGWSELRQALADCVIEPQHLRLLRDGVRVPDMFYSDPQGVRLERLDQLLENGCSLIFETLDRDLEPLRSFTDELRALLREYVTVGAVVTTGSRGALDLHYDEEDILAFQAEGTKRWQLHAPTMRNPLKHGPKAPLPAGTPLLEVDLEPGDMLFVPAGYWHQCENRSARSVHYSALIIPLSITDVLNAMHEQVLANEHWRRPLARGGQTAADEETLKVDLVKLVHDLRLDHLQHAQISRGRAAPAPAPERQLI